MSTAPVSRADNLETVLARARKFLAEGRSDEAYASYLEVLSRDSAHPAALHELGCVAHMDGYHSAARTIYERIVHHWPQDAIGRVNLGNILYEDGNFSAARIHFETVLKADAGFVDANRGLARILSEEGDAEAADRHWRRSFSGQAIVTQLFRGRGAPLPVLLLVSAKGGNIPTRNILDDRIFAVTALYAEYYEPDLPLPPHALVFNAIGDADLCPIALTMADAIAARTGAPIINQPALVSQTGRAANAARLATLPGLRTPRIQTSSREALASAKELAFPLLLRAKGFHTGQHFVRVERREDLETAAAGLPGQELLAIEYLDARGTDGMARKYRVMCIDGVIYPIHLAVSSDWKVHYFTAGMSENAAHRAEEARFLENMAVVLGAPAMATLADIGKKLGLDYAGMDFALDNDGRILLFETNATMVIIPPPPGPIWDYRRVPIARALNAAKDMLVARSRQQQ